MDNKLSGEIIGAAIEVHRLTRNLDWSLISVTVM
jgi:hypothetical protein